LHEKGDTAEWTKFKDLVNRTQLSSGKKVGCRGFYSLVFTEVFCFC